MKKSIFLFFAAILCAMSVSAKVIYFKPNGNWAQANANFYAHVWGGSGATSPVKFTPVATDPTVYEAEIGTHNQVIFLRMDPSKTVTSSNMWNNPPLWNRMGNISIPADGKNCCTIKDGQWSQEKNTTNGAASYVTWSTYTPPTVVVIPDRYITGTIAGGWNANDVKMTYDEATETYSHTFTAVAAGELHQFKVTDGTWSKNWGGDAVSPAIEGVTTGSDGNVAFTLSTGGDVTITFKDSKIQLTTTGSFTPVETFEYYVVGSFNSWNTADAAYGMTKDGDVYKKEVTFAADVQFKVCKGSWDAGVWGANNLGDNTYKELGGTDNLEMKEEKTFTIIFNPSENLITFEGLTPEAVVKYDYYIAGTLAGGWSAKQQGMTKDGDVYKHTFTELNAGTYQFKITDGQWNSEGDATHEHTTLGAAYEEVSYVDGNIQIITEEAINLTVIFNATTDKITFEGLTEKAPEPTYDYYLTGSLVGGWDVKQQGIEKDGELYKATFTDLAAGEYEFKITKGDWEHQWNYSNLDKAYEEVSEGKDGEGNPNGNIKIVTTAVKTITVNFDATANKISLEGLTPYVAPLTYTVTVPAGTDKCYIAGAMNGWNFQEMTATANANEFTIEIAGARETDGYKYACQASWDYVEKDKDGNDLADNRTWKENDKVEKWGKPIVVTYQLKGVGGWDQPGIELVQNPDPEKASEYMLTCQAISATDAIKVVRLENGEIKDYYGNGTVKDGVEVAVNYDGDGNITLPAGKYNFYFDTNESEKKLWIAAATDCGTEPTPDYTRGELTAGKFGTICLPFGGTVEGAELFECVGQETGKVYLASVTTLEAGVPYIFKATATELAVYSDGTTAATPDDHNGLYGTFTDNTEVAIGNYILYNNALCQAEATCYVNANRAYLVMGEVPEGAPTKMPGRRYVSMGTQGTNATTGVDNLVVPEGQTIKVIENGQLIIIRGGEKFNVQGQKL